MSVKSTQPTARVSGTVTPGHVPVFTAVPGVLTDGGATPGTGTVTTTGTPASGNLAKFSGTTSVTNGDLSGDVSTSGTLATTIGANKVTNAMQAQMAAHTFKGNNTGSTANPIDMTATQATAELNAVVGDSGSGGTKGLVPAPAAGAAAAGQYLDAAGTFSVPPGSGAAIGIATITSTGTVNDMSFSNASLVRLNNATDLTITGLVAGAAGQTVTFVSIGAGNVYFANANSGSTAANQLTNRVTSGVTPVAANKGYVSYQYDTTSTKWRLVNHDQGEWISVAYASGNFTTDTGTWTVDSGDQTEWIYKVVGGDVQMIATLSNTSVATNPTQLRMTLPNSYTISAISSLTGFVLRAFNAGTLEVTGTIQCDTASSTYIYLRRNGGAAWSAATNTTSANIYVVVPLT